MNGHLFQLANEHKGIWVPGDAVANPHVWAFIPLDCTEIEIHWFNYKMQSTNTI